MEPRTLEWITYINNDTFKKELNNCINLSSKISLFFTINPYLHSKFILKERYNIDDETEAEDYANLYVIEDSNHNMWGIVESMRPNSNTLLFIMDNEKYNESLLQIHVYMGSLEYDRVKENDENDFRVLYSETNLYWGELENNDFNEWLNVLSTLIESSNTYEKLLGFSFDDETEIEEETFEFEDYHNRLYYSLHKASILAIIESEQKFLANTKGWKKYNSVTLYYAKYVMPLITLDPSNNNSDVLQQLNSLSNLKYSIFYETEKGTWGIDYKLAYVFYLDCFNMTYAFAIIPNIDTLKIFRFPYSNNDHKQANNLLMFYLEKINIQKNKRDELDDVFPFYICKYSISNIVQIDHFINNFMLDKARNQDLSKIEKSYPQYMSSWFYRQKTIKDYLESHNISY